MRGLWILAFCLAGLGGAWAAAEETAADEKRIDALIRQLGADEYERRVNAEEALRKLGFPAFKKLRDAQDGDDVEIRLRARNIIGNYDELKALLDKLPQDWHTTLYYSGMTETQRKLAAFGGAALPYLEDRLKHEPDLYRFNCVTVLNAIHTPAALECLRKLAADNYAWCRVEAVWALGNAQDAGSLPVLIKALEDQDETVRKEALLGVGKVAGLKIFGLTPTVRFEFTAISCLPKEAHQELERVAKYYLENKKMPEAENLTTKRAAAEGQVVMVIGGDPVADMLGEKLKDDWKIKLFKVDDGKEYWLIVHFSEEPEFLKDPAKIQPTPQNQPAAGE